MIPLNKPGTSTTGSKTGMRMAAPTTGTDSGPGSTVLSTEELNGRFQASGSSSEDNVPMSKPRALFEKMWTPLAEVATTGKALVEKGSEQMEKRRLKSEHKAKTRYENKRRTEVQQQRWEREHERKAQRMAKKYGDQ